MEKICIYTANAEKKQKISELAKNMKIRLVEISPKDLPRTVGAIAGISKESKKNVKIPAFYQMPEVMILSGLNDKKLDLFLETYRLAQIEPIPLKAIVTLHNCAWTLFYLIEELRKEHQAMSH